MLQDLPLLFLLEAFLFTFLIFPLAAAHCHHQVSRVMVTNGGGGGGVRLISMQGEELIVLLAAHNFCRRLEERGG